VGYDRAAKDDLCTRHGVALADVLGDDFVGFDWLPIHGLAPGERVEVPLWFAHWSGPAPAELTLSLRWGDGVGSSHPFTSTPWQVTPIDGVEVDAPADAGEHVLVAEVFDGSDRICANRITVTVE
jgi:hypothetical protein